MDCVFSLWLSFFKKTHPKKTATDPCCRAPPPPQMGRKPSAVAEEYFAQVEICRVHRGWQEAEWASKTAAPVSFTRSPSNSCPF